MADQPVPFNTFRGLNLRDAPDSVEDQCIDCLNVDLDRSGTKVRSRYGYNNLTASAAAGAYAFLHRQSSTALIAGRAANNLESVDSAGAVTSLSTSYYPTEAVNIGTPTTTSTYLSTAANATTPIRKVVGTTFSSPTATVDGVAGKAMPVGYHLGVQDTDNRLVASTHAGSTGPNGVASSSHHVWFSEPGNAEAWTSTNYVQLTPGDDELIRAIVSWRGSVFVFKDTRLFVFYGNSTDAAGNAIFNYRVVQLPSYFLPTHEPGVGEEGVYYAGRDGIYVTRGDVPTLLSGDIYPLFTDDPIPPFFSALTGKIIAIRAFVYHKRRLLISVSTLTAEATLVYDIDTANWFVWDIAPVAFCPWEGEGGTGLLYFAGDTSANHVYRFKSTFADDDGTAISSYYRTGFYDLGDGDQKTIHNVDIWGTGTINYSSARDFNATMGTARSVTLGTSPAIGYGRVQPSADTARGNLFSHKFADSSGGAWSIQRVVQNVQAKRPPGPKGT